MKDPLSGLRLAFSNEERPRIFTGSPRPGGCRGFSPGANPRMTTTCVRCGKTEDKHE